VATSGAAQKDMQHHLIEAYTYARSVMSDPKMYSFYEQEARKKKKNAYHMALSGYFKVKRRLEEFCRP
jgi:hypothetical protein